MLAFEVEAEILHGENVRGLPTDGVYRVIGKRAGWDRQIRRPNRYGAAVLRYLPLVVADKANLQELAEVLFQRENLPKTPLHGEGLPRSLLGAVGALPGPVNLPVCEEVRTGPFVLGDVVGYSVDQVIAEVTAPDVIRSARSITPRGKYHSFSDLEVRSLQVPGQAEGLNKGIGKPTSTRDRAEVGDARILGRKIRYELACRGYKPKKEEDVSVHDVRIQYAIEQIFNCPDVVIARDRDSTATCVIECAGTIVDRDVDVAKPGSRCDPRI